jgi:cell division protein FtsQ
MRLAVVALLAAAVWALFWSPLLSVRDVRVLGAKHTSVVRVKEASGLSGDENLLLLSTERVARAVESLPWVESASVDRKLPATVRVRVTERQPALMVTRGAKAWTLDAEGRVLAVGRPAREVPVLTGVTASGLRPGRQVDSPAILGALATWRALPPRLERRVEAMFAPTVERTALSLRSGTAVRIGAPEDLAAKSAVLLALLRRLDTEGRTPAYIDVRVPTNPAVSVASAG